MKPYLQNNPTDLLNVQQYGTFASPVQRAEYYAQRAESFGATNNALSVTLS
jgi:hypothetical protein